MTETAKKALFTGLRRIVVKLGSSVVATPGGVDRDRIGRLAAEVARARAEGIDVVVVTSGARAAGLSRLGLSAIPTRIAEQQAAAAVGQIRLMSLYERLFAEHDLHVGQVLLTAGDIEDRTRYLNAKHTLVHLLDHGVVPIVNENDSVAIEELKFGDNDRLSALVAGLVGADVLVLLTDVDGLYAGDPSVPGTPLVTVVEDADRAAAELEAGTGAGAAGALGSGGMLGKLRAARSASHRGVTTVIANGTVDGILSRALDPGDDVGTLVLPSASPISHRKHWIAYGVPRRGKLVVDAGAVAAVAGRGSSLLAAGIRRVEGSFAAGDCVGCIGPDGLEFARGLVAYDAADCERIRGASSGAIRERLGYHIADEVVHRDDLVLLADVAAPDDDGSTP